MKKFFMEFKEFASRGDAMNMAVGVIIGGAFQGIVNSLVNDIISPIIGLFSNRDFSYLVLKIRDVEIKYGSFITAFINFIIMTFIIFIIIKLMNKLAALGEKALHLEKKEVAPTTKKCPYCMSEIDINATKCPHCTSDLSN